MLRKIESPKYEQSAFTCPSCTAFSKHDWNYVFIEKSKGYFYTHDYNNCEIMASCRCEHCGNISFWYKEKLIWPLNKSVEPALVDMPADIKKLYDEASDIVELSPKGACAILRLALQKLCNRLANQDEKKKIDGAIKILVENGLPKTLQEAMDTIRIVGDEAVHPGEINLDDNKELALAMFRLLNIIVEKIIVEPKDIEELYSLMPDNKLKGIENRDKKDKKEKK